MGFVSLGRIDLQGTIQWAKPNPGGDQWDESEKSPRAFEGNAQADEAQADKQTNSAIRDSNVRFHKQASIRQRNIHLLPTLETLGHRGGVRLAGIGAPRP